MQGLANVPGHPPQAQHSHRAPPTRPAPAIPAAGHHRRVRPVRRTGGPADPLLLPGLARRRGARRPAPAPGRPGAREGGGGEAGGAADVGGAGVDQGHRGAGEGAGAGGQGGGRRGHRRRCGGSHGRAAGQGEGGAGRHRRRCGGSHGRAAGERGGRAGRRGQGVAGEQRVPAGAGGRRPRRPPGRPPDGPRPGRGQHHGRQHRRIQLVFAARAPTGAPGPAAANAPRDRGVGSDRQAHSEAAALGRRPRRGHAACHQVQRSPQADQMRSAHAHRTCSGRPAGGAGRRPRAGRPPDAPEHRGAGVWHG
mmetsp:Transcript_120452/g.275934  ORF Transcript_120452/g.275934 Transcript_120452/m.275934 type:complete len:308 (-) Transcript_120452:665-1588(-)